MIIFSDYRYEPEPPFEKSSLHIFQQHTFTIIIIVLKQFKLRNVRFPTNTSSIYCSVNSKFVLLVGIVWVPEWRAAPNARSIYKVCTGRSISIGIVCDHVSATSLSTVACWNGSSCGTWDVQTYTTPTRSSSDEITLSRRLAKFMYVYSILLKMICRLMLSFYARP